MATEFKYYVSRYGDGFTGPGQTYLGLAITKLNRKLRRIAGPYTIDNPELEKDGVTKRDRKATIRRVREILASPGAKNIKLIIRGSHYDKPGYAIMRHKFVDEHPIIDEAAKYLGNNYLLGAVPPPTADCSGLTMKATQGAYGISLPHSAYQQADDFRMHIFYDAGNLQPDDFIFYVYGRLGGTIDHVALFARPGVELGSRPSTGGVAYCDIDWSNVVKYGRLIR